jgi:hypothetical protein
MQSVQSRLIVVVLVGLIFGCLIGGGLGLYYAWMVNPVVYGDGAYPKDLAQGYQEDYINMVSNAYLVDRQVENAQTRLQSFDDTVVIMALGERSVALVANGQAVEAQAVNDLAAELSAANGWDPNVVATQISTLAVKYQDDAAKAQAVNSFGASLGVVPAGAAPPAAEGEQPPAVEGQAPPPAEDSGGFDMMSIVYCLLGLLLIVVVVLLIGNWYFKKSRSGPKGPQIEWDDQEGPPPIMQWSGTYTLGQDNYDEFFTVETPDGDFLGESGVGILEAVPGTSPKQVTAFDVGLFDKTDITTLSRVLMTPQAFNDPSVQAKIEANPMAEAVLAEPGKEFSLETSALRVTAKIDDLAFGAADEYFEKLKISLNVFVNEGADLKIGEMDVPDGYQS